MRATSTCQIPLALSCKPGNEQQRQICQLFHKDCPASAPGATTNTHAVRLTAAQTSAEAMQEAPAKAAAPVLAKSSSAPTAAAAQPSSGSATGGKTSAAAVPAPASNSSGLAPVTAAPAMLPATVSRPTEPAAADAEPAAGNMANAVLPRKYGIPVVQDPPYTLKSALSGAKTSCRAAATALLSSMTVALMVVF